MLVLVIVVVPMISTLAEQHESQHLIAGDAYFDAVSDHDAHANLDQNKDTNDSVLHFLAHASHCCGHIVALLPDALHLVLMSAHSLPSIRQEHSFAGLSKVTHFRPPINF